MNKMKWTLTTLVASLLIMTSAAATQATVLRAFVSSAGADANAATNCAQTAPCRTFAGAFPTVTAGGELIALDTSGYGPLTGGSPINKAITIATVPGATAFVVAAFGTAAFTVSAGVSDLVILRNISFNGAGAAGTSGIIFITGKGLVVENCTFTSLTGSGLAASSGVISIKDSSFNASGNGITFSQTAKGEVVNTEVRHSSIDGLFVNTGGKATVIHSKFIGNTSRGVYATNAGSEIYLLEVIVAYNGVGLKGDNTAGGGGGCGGNDGGKVFVDRSSITDNTKGAEGIANSCAVLSLLAGTSKFNTMQGNGTVNDLGTITGSGGYPGQ
jgi:hypothetical protein